MEQSFRLVSTLQLCLYAIMFNKTLDFQCSFLASVLLRNQRLRFDDFVTATERLHDATIA